MAAGEDRRYFDRKLKYEAIRLMNEGKRSVGDIAKDLDIHPNVLHSGGVSIGWIWSMPFLVRGI